MTVKILIADDQVLLSRALATILGSQPDLEVVATVHDGQAAVDTVAHTPVDLVLMDVRMPGMDGISATRAVARRFPTVKVLVLTTYDQDEFAFGALSAGASGFLLKDTRTADLHQALRAVSSGDAILTPRITRELLNRHMLSPVASPRQRAARQRLDDLSPREREVADLVAQGLTNAEIAQRLVLAPDSVKKNVTRILTKLDLRDRVQLVILMRDAQS